MEPADPPEMVLRRANDLWESNGFGDYELTANNCFDFAFYCKTGSRYFRLRLLVQNKTEPGWDNTVPRPLAARCTIQWKD